MVQDDATFGAPGGEPTPTPEAAPPIAADFMSSIMARLARQDEVQKTTNDQLAALVAALTAPDGQTSHPQQIRRRPFYNNPTATGGDHISDDSEPNETLLADHPPVGDTNAILSKMNAPKAPAAKNANTRQEPSQHAPIDKNGRKDGYMYVVNENNVAVSTLVVRGEGWNKWSNGEADSSADEEQPANRRRIEVILSQQTLSSDDENDDTPVLEDLRDVLKRKFESENSNSSTLNDLRTTLNARKSWRISAVDPDPKERLNGDLRDKLNAGACDLRIRLNRSKPTDLRRPLEQTKMSTLLAGRVSRPKVPGLEGALSRPVYLASRIKAQRGTKLGHQGQESYKKGRGSNKKWAFGPLNRLSGQI
ncbi:hypothetical protein F2Q69_00030406 [Brassica cretica]|uniref:Uncharacterized protein n=1 Tax=Brassica cretica TaxID=69181 RepID=A0A8S9RTC7_BRACR|nr:hypothetical protein F2Q69_00030406 [Brassica cretica]